MVSVTQIEEQIRLVDVRMEGVAFYQAALSGAFVVAGVSSRDSLCYLVRKGTLWLKVEGFGRGPIELGPGAIVGLSGYVPHHFANRLDADPRHTQALSLTPLSQTRPAGDVELIVGQAPLETVAWSNLLFGAVVIDASAGAVWKRVWKAVEAIEEELSDAEPLPGRDAAVRRQAEIMLLNITRFNFMRTEAGGMTELGALSDLSIMRAVASAAADPLHAWTLERMAGAASMSRSAFAARFHELTGSSPSQTLTRIRLRLAATELASGRGKPLDEVAESAGYSSAAAFIRAFRRLYGSTPAKWRSAHAKRDG